MLGLQVGKLLCLSGGLSFFFLLVKELGHVARALVNVDGVILLGLLVSNHLEVGFSAILLLLLVVFDHLLLVLLGQHFLLGEVDGPLLLGLFLFLEFSLLRQSLELLRPLLLFLLLHLLESQCLSLLSLSGLFLCLVISDGLAEAEHVRKRGVVLFKGGDAFLGLLCDLGSLGLLGSLWGLLQQVGLILGWLAVVMVLLVVPLLVLLMMVLIALKEHPLFRFQRLLQLNRLHRLIGEEHRHCQRS